MAEDSPHKPGNRDEPSETFGPLALTRHVKDDGRALILYARRDAVATTTPDRGA